MTGQVRTFLIADVRGYTQFTVQHGDEAAAQLAARFAEIATAVASARDGQVIEVRGDEVLAVFSSARQALRAAMDLQTRLKKESMPLGAGVGLDAGEAVPVGDGYRGAALNLAARLCSLAGPGEVLASDTVVNLARKIDGVTYAERGAVQLKGFADPVRVVEVRSSVSEAPETSPIVPMRWREAGTGGQRLPIGGFLGSLPSGTLVGRDEELDRILRAVDAVEAGEGQLVMLTGEPGAGKTRLAQEATLHLHNGSFLIAAGSCYEARQAVPYSPFLDALAALYAMAPRVIRSAVPQRWPYLGRLLPDAPIPAVVTGMSTQEEHDRLLRAVTAFTQACADEVPVALLLDDLHWADESSLQLLQHLARHTRTDRVLLLGTYRDVEVGAHHPLERALRDLRRDGLMERVALHRLGRENTAELLAATLGVETISDELSDLVYDHTEGNPFFTQEVVRALVERGDIYREDRHWERRKIAHIDVPESIRSVIVERLSRLDEEGQHILYEASILGQTFGFDELQAISSRTEQSIEDALDGAIAAGLIRETGKETYAFNHALTQRALYTELSGRRRRRLHLAAGVAIEGLPERIRSQRSAEIAWHFLEADDPDRAFPYAIRAGGSAEAIFAYAEAEKHYRTALGLAQELGDTEREAKAADRLGIVLERIGRYDEALLSLERVATLQHEANRIEDEARVLSAIGRIYDRRGTPEAAIERLETFLQGYSESELGHARMHLLASLSRLRYTVGDYSEAARVGETAAALARDVGDQLLFLAAERQRLAVLQKLGQRKTLRDAYEELARAAEAAGDLHALWGVLDSLGDISLFYLDRGRSTLYRTQSLEVAERLGDPALLTFATFKLGWTAFEVGDWAQSRILLERSLETARAAKSSGTGLYAMFGLGLLYVGTGDWTQADELLEKCLRSDDLQIRRHAAWVAADKDLLEGRPDLALARLVPLLDRPGLKEVDVALLLPFLAQAHREMGDISLAQELAGKAVRRAEAAEDPDALLDALRVCGAVHAADGQWEAALASLQEGLAVARSLIYPYAEARLLYEEGRTWMARSESTVARQRLERALAIFQQLGAQPYIDRTEQSLAALE